MRNHDLTVLNQTTQVFVYEEPGETVNACENGTLNLLKILSEGNVVTARELHLLRKEFIQRVFTYYIVKLGAGTEED